jgi:hypothetical protein
MGRRTKDAAFEEQERVRIRQVEFPRKQMDRKHRCLWRATMNQDEERSLPTKIANEEMEETVYHKGLKSSGTATATRINWCTRLINVSQNVNHERGLEREKRDEGRHRVNRNH